MNESTTITIDNIVKLIEGIAKAEYQRGYVAGLEEQRLTEKHWGRKQPEKPILDKIKAELNKYDDTAFIKAKYVQQIFDKYTEKEPCEEDKTE